MRQSEGGRLMKMRVLGASAMACFVIGTVSMDDVQAQAMGFAQAPQDSRTVTRPSRRVVQPRPVESAAPKPLEPSVETSPVTINMPTTDPNTPLGLALAHHCSTGYPQDVE